MRSRRRAARPALWTLHPVLCEEACRRWRFTGRSVAPNGDPLASHEFSVYFESRRGLQPVVLSTTSTGAYLHHLASGPWLQPRRLEPTSSICDTGERWRVQARRRDRVGIPCHRADDLRSQWQHVLVLAVSELALLLLIGASFVRGYARLLCGKIALSPRSYRWLCA